VKAKLLCDAGRIAEGTDVDVVAKSAEDTGSSAHAGVDGADASPSYTVTDADGRAETVDTRDLAVVL
jgi:hypothetical protein